MVALDGGISVPKTKCVISRGVRPAVEFYAYTFIGRVRIAGWHQDRVLLWDLIK